jgi:hypothetical protein
VHEIVAYSYLRYGWLPTVGSQLSVPANSGDIYRIQGAPRGAALVGYPVTRVHYHLDRKYYLVVCDNHRRDRDSVELIGSELLLEYGFVESIDDAISNAEANNWRN